MKRNIFLIILVVICVFLVGCNSTHNISSNDEDSEKLKVYTSFYTMYDFAQKIGGDRIELTNIIPSGTEPHEWEPNPRDLVALEKADVLIYNGAGMENWITKITGSLKNKNLVILEASNGVELLNDSQSHNHLEHKHEHGTTDPHVWLNPLNAAIELKNITEVFKKSDPVNQEYYENNFQMCLEKINQIDEKYVNVLSNCENTKIVVTHKAFGYLCNRYGLEQVALQGISSDTEPSMQKMAEIINFIKNNNISTIFMEKNSNEKIVKTISKETGVKIGVLETLEGLSKSDIENGREYFSVMESNLEQLQKALA